jgi:hypothetical protein
VYRDIPEELRVLIEPVVGDAGFELVDALLTRGRAPWLLRVTIDTPEGDGRVPIERCAAVSREIGSQLDASARSRSLSTEVSSPVSTAAGAKDLARAWRGNPIDAGHQGPPRFCSLLLAFEAAQGLGRRPRDRHPFSKSPRPFDYRFTRDLPSRD